jgi:hypothetical protein
MVERAKVFQAEMEAQEKEAKDVKVKILGEE